MYIVSINLTKVQMKIFNKILLRNRDCSLVFFFSDLVFSNRLLSCNECANLMIDVYLNK